MVHMLAPTDYCERLGFCTGMQSVLKKKKLEEFIWADETVLAEASTVGGGQGCQAPPATCQQASPAAQVERPSVQ
eukprot:128846-Chlamydomonas_euryale.AAC.1